MGKIYKNLLETIGNTPLVKLNKYVEEHSCRAKIFAKVESFNPAGSVKDRVALNMIEDAENKGMIKPGSVIIEPTSGNTGIGLACVAAVKGYKVILTMPNNMSKERCDLLKAYGAELVLTDKEEGMKGAIEKAKELSESIKDSFMPQQFNNMANVDAHIKTTGKEIWEDIEGRVDIFVAGVGTGGTITGIGKYLKSKNKDVEIVAVEPSDSAVLSGEKAGVHEIQGIGAGFIPEILDRSIYDKVFKVEKGNAFFSVKQLVKTEGILVGISSGAALYAATQIAKLKENENKNIVVLLPDSGERYLSTSLFE